jgi:hypothetical protein
MPLLATSETHLTSNGFIQKYSEKQTLVGGIFSAVDPF